MRRRPVLSVPRLLLATLVCVVAGALLHPTTAAAAVPTAVPTAVPSAVAARVLAAPSPELPGLSGPVTQAQAAAWHLDGATATTLTTPGGSTVVLTPAEVLPGSADFRAKVRWWGVYRVFFNKLETLQIAAGSAACVAIVKHVPVVGPYLATACALLGVYATYASARNECVLAQGWGLHYPQVLLYRGGYCR
ncbi:MAG TPA: hypothetical protein VKB14_09540 [Actinomycetales bacterium]|nr:hypothetical protein [Actinomycetales bacterium]